jgi:predicted DNA-binding transcriptional regulator AlpA
MDKFLREKQILGDSKAKPPIEPILPISRSSWWEGVKSGRYPAATKLGPRTTVWRESEIQALIEQPETERGYPSPKLLPGPLCDQLPEEIRPEAAEKFRDCLSCRYAGAL